MEPVGAPGNVSQRPSLTPFWIRAGNRVYAGPKLGQAREIERCCRGTLRVIASIERPDIIERILEHLNRDRASIDSAQPSWARRLAACHLASQRQRGLANPMGGFGRPPPSVAESLISLSSWERFAGYG